MFRKIMAMLVGIAIVNMAYETMYLEVLNPNPLTALSEILLIFTIVTGVAAFIFGKDAWE